MRYVHGSYWYVFFKNADGKTSWYKTLLINDGDDPLKNATQFVLDNLISVEPASGPIPE